jgi:hypothetical protein
MELQDFQQTDSFGPVSRFEKQVTTPQLKEETKRGEKRYCDETNQQTAYKCDNCVVKVKKVAGRGWTATRYVDGTPDRFMDGYAESEEAAHEVAREMIESFL